ERLLHGRRDLLDVEALAGLDADAPHLRDDRLIGDVRGSGLEQLRGVGEVFAGRHGVDLCLRRRLHVDARFDLRRYRLGRLAPFGQRRDAEAGLDLAHGLVVSRAVGLGAADDPHDRRGRVDALDIAWQLELLDETVAQIGTPVGWGDQEVAGLRAGGAPARGG